MAARPALLVFALLLLAPALPRTAQSVALCDSTSKGFIPLTELGAGTYQGFTGGLYPGEANTPPAAHLADGLALAGTLTPLDTLGVPSGDGRIVLLSVGMSNTTQEYSTFIPLAIGSGLKNPRVQLVDGAQGGQTAAVFANPNANAWTVIENRLRNAGARAAQVQAVWLKEANAGPTQAFPLHAQMLRDDLRAVVQNLHAKFPNLKLCYLSSRIYAGYASTPLNPEPYAYESGFAVRWLIEEQIAGNAALNHDPDAGPVMAPWLAWGPYLWADGLVPRADGLIWECADFNNDGTHPAPSGRAKVARMLLDFFTTDPTAVPWFSMKSVAVDEAADASTPSAARLAGFRPNPFFRLTAVSFELARPARVTLEVYSPAGARVRGLAELGYDAGRHTVTWDGRDDAGRRAPPGVYFVRFVADGVVDTGKALLLP